jgi:hypothetical protein
MTGTHLLVGSFLGVLAAAGCQPPASAPPAATAAAAPAAAGVPTLTAPVALFNGKDLTGWVQVLDSKWTVEDGILLARQDPSGRRDGESWLVTEKDFTDFILKTTFRVTAGGNSGVFLRDPIPRAQRQAAADGASPPPWEAACEANINAVDPEYPTGSIWSVAKGAKGLEKAGDWNEMVALVKGDRISTWVNGQPAVVDAQQTRTQRGGIGLQRHGTAQYREKLVEFKEIAIQEL